MYEKFWLFFFYSFTGIAIPVKCMSSIAATPGIYCQWNIRHYIVAISFYSILFLVSGSVKMTCVVVYVCMYVCMHACMKSENNVYH